MKVVYTILLVCFCLVCSGPISHAGESQHGRGGFEATRLQITIPLSAVEVAEDVQEIEPIVIELLLIDNHDCHHSVQALTLQFADDGNRFLYDDTPLHIKIRSILI